MASTKKWIQRVQSSYALRNNTRTNAQKESIETLIYLFEIEKIRTRKDLLEKFAYTIKDLRLPPHDEFTDTVLGWPRVVAKPK